MKRSESNELHDSILSNSRHKSSTADSSPCNPSNLDQTREALDALEEESNLENEFNFKFDGEFNDAPDQEDEIEDLTLDETELLVGAYLDGELDDAEREHFEDRMRHDDELRRDVESQRNTLYAVDELVETRHETNHELMEKTVERLNEEAKTELERLQAKRKALNRRALLLQIGAPIICFVGGYLVFGLILPNPAKQRENDVKVVSRIAQLEAVGNFEYLKALADSNLFAERHEDPNLSPTELNRRPQTARSYNASTAVEESVAELDESASKRQMYRKLIQDPVFYRLQRRFEALDKPTQEKWREFRKQIDADPDREKLLKTLDDYTVWLVRSTNSTERQRLEEMPIPVRILELRRKLEDARRFSEFVKQHQMKTSSGSGPLTGQRSNNPEPDNKPNPLGASLRSALPTTLQKENLRPIYEKYMQYQRDVERQEPAHEDFDDILDFLTNVDVNEIVAEFSKESRDYINTLEPQKRSSLMGLVVSLSFLENAERFVPTRPMQGPPQPNRFFDSNGRGNSVQALAQSLRDADPQMRELIFSSPAMEANGILMGLHWGFFPKPNQPFSSRNNPTKPENPPKLKPENQR